jgi:hypothetical protein
MSIQWRDGFSAKVAIALQLNGKRLPIARIGPASFTLRDPCDIAPSSSAQIVIQVDGNREERAVLLHRGATVASPEVEYI